ncbi:MAG: glycosyltransferase family 39 protein [Anaerolineae bacterium]|nr:glycosyltransferase family 39 protein [Anaerolineae bacterium]
MQRHNPQSTIHNPQFSILLIILLATSLRLAQPDLVEFKYDEAHTLTVAAQVAQGQALPRVSGETSWGVERPAFSFYLFAAPAAVGRNPALSVLFSGLLGVLAVAGTYRLAAEFFDRPTALAAALFYAVNPWCILYERKLWAHPLPLLSVLILYLSYRLVLRRQPWAALPLLLALGVQGQTHVLAWLYLPFVFLLLLFTWRRWRALPTLLGAGAWVLVTLPYAAYLWPQRADVWGRVNAQVLDQPAQVDAAALRQTLHLAAGTRIQELLSPEGALRFLPYRTWLTWTGALMAALLLAGLAYAIWSCLRAPGERERHALLLLWLAVPLLLLTRHSIKVQRQYLTLLIPGLFLLAALPLGRLLRGSFPPGAGAGHAPVQKGKGQGLSLLPPASCLLPLAALALLAFTAFTQASSVLAFYGAVDRYGAGGGFDVPLRYWQRAAAAARTVAAAHGLSEIAVMTEGVDPVYEGRPTLLAYLLRPPLDPRFLNGEETPALLLPWERELLYLTTVEQPDVLAALQGWGREEATVRVPDGPTLRIWTLPARPAQELAAWPQQPLSVPFDNGARLWGVDLPAAMPAGGSATLRAWWALDEVLPEQVTRMWSIFNHLLDEEGARWGQGDGLGLPSAFWRPGDHFLQWTPIQVQEDTPAGVYRLVTGLYSAQDGRRAQCLDAQGQPRSDTFLLGRVQVTRGP